MSTNAWVRGFLPPKPWTTVKQYWLLTSLAAGQTLERTRLAWWFGGYTSTTIVPEQTFGIPMAMGLVTTIGPIATDTPPDPFTQGADQAPPSQRWLWHEQRWPTIAAWDAFGRTVAWKSSPPGEETDSHGQVKAPVMAVGSTLNVWLVFRAQTTWDPSGAATVAAFANCLVRSP